MNTIERNRNRVLGLYEDGFNAGRLEVVDDCIAAGSADHQHPLGDDEPDTRSHVRNVILMLRAAMPDLHVRIEDTVAEGNRVALRLTTEGHHTGAPLFGAPARGGAIRASGFQIVEFDDDGLVVRDWGTFGVEDMRRQAGGIDAAPGSEPAPFQGATGQAGASPA